MRDVEKIPATHPHLSQVAIVELIGDVPSDAENDDRAVEVTASEWGGEGRD
jgi:hypothetical protein